MTAEPVEYTCGTFDYPDNTSHDWNIFQHRHIEVQVHPTQVNIYLRDTTAAYGTRQLTRITDSTARGLAICACQGQGTLPILADWCDENGIDPIFGQWMRICVDTGV